MLSRYVCGAKVAGAAHALVVRLPLHCRREGPTKAWHLPGAEKVSGPFVLLIPFFPGPTTGPSVLDRPTRLAARLSMCPPAAARNGLPMPRW